MFTSLVRTTKRFVPHLVLLISLVIMLFPIIWIFITSFKLERDYYSYPPIWLPREITFDHYIGAFTLYDITPYLFNSIILSIGSALLVMLVSVPAAYSVTNFKTGGGLFMFWILLQRMMPPVILILPLFILLNKLGLMDTFFGLIMTYSVFNIPFAVWLLISFYEDIPPSLRESGLIDGCTEIKVMVKIVTPLILPGVTVVMLFVFVFIWNNLMIPLTLSRIKTRTLMSLIASTMHSPTGTLFGEASASATIGIIPAFIITLLLQRYLVRGLTSGGVKG